MKQKNQDYTQEKINKLNIKELSEIVSNKETIDLLSQEEFILINETLQVKLKALQHHKVIENEISSLQKNKKTPTLNVLASKTNLDPLIIEEVSKTIIGEDKYPLSFIYDLLPKNYLYSLCENFDTIKQNFLLMEDKQKEILDENKKNQLSIKKYIKKNLSKKKDLKKSIQEKTQELSTLNKNLKETQDDLTSQELSHKSKIQELEDSSKIKIQELESDFNIKNQELSEKLKTKEEELKNTIELKDDSIDKITQENTELKESLEKTELQVETKEQAIGAISSSLTQSKSDNKSLEEKISLLQSQVEEKTKELQAQEEKLAQLDNAPHKRSQEDETLILNLNREIESFDTKTKTLEDKIKTLEQEKEQAIQSSQENTQDPSLKLELEENTKKLEKAMATLEHQKKIIESLRVTDQNKNQADLSSTQASKLEETIKAQNQDETPLPPENPSTASTPNLKDSRLDDSSPAGNPNSQHSEFAPTHPQKDASSVTPTQHHQDVAPKKKKINISLDFFHNLSNKVKISIAAFGVITLASIASQYSGFTPYYDSIINQAKSFIPSDFSLDQEETKKMPLTADLSLDESEMELLESGDMIINQASDQVKEETILEKNKDSQLVLPKRVSQKKPKKITNPLAAQQTNDSPLYIAPTKPANPLKVRQPSKPLENPLSIVDDSKGSQNPPTFSKAKSPKSFAKAKPLSLKTQELTKPSITQENTSFNEGLVENKTNIQKKNIDIKTLKSFIKEASINQDNFVYKNKTYKKGENFFGFKIVYISKKLNSIYMFNPQNNETITVNK